MHYHHDRLFEPRILPVMKAIHLRCKSVSTRATKNRAACFVRLQPIHDRIAALLPLGFLGQLFRCFGIEIELLLRLSSTVGASVANLAACSHCTRTRAGYPKGIPAICGYRRRCEENAGKVVGATRQQKGTGFIR